MRFLRRKLWLEYSNHRSGNVALTFGLLLIPLCGFIGVAVDTTVRYKIQGELQAAADTAVLFYVKNSDSNKAAELANKLFNNNLSAAARKRLVLIDFQLKTDTQRNTLLGVATFKADVETTFMRVFGIDKTTAAGSAQATKARVAKVDFHVLADSSDSMGLASDARQQADLMFFTTQAYRSGKLAGSQSNCAFACHMKDSNKTSTLAVARANNVDLRVDVARRGIVNLLGLSEKSEKVKSRYAIYTFNTELFDVLSITTDLKQAAERAALLEVGFGRTQGQDANTSFDVITPKFVEKLKSHIATLGAEDAPSQVVILVSDGLKSQNCAACAGRQNVYPFKLEHCNLIKSTGAKLAVIYTEYLQMSWNQIYQDHASHAVPLIEANMKACATPGLYAKGDTPAQIEAAFGQIFAQVSQDLHLSQ